jgi:hypothetical protein
MSKRLRLKSYLLRLPPQVLKPFKRSAPKPMQANLMYRQTSNLWISVGLPAAALLFIVFGLQTTGLLTQLFLSIGAVAIFFSVLIFAPYFLERHAAMRSVYMRYDAMQAAVRIREQRTQYFTLNRALSRHQLRGRGQLATIRS